MTGIKSSSRQRIVRDWIHVNRLAGRILETRPTEDNPNSILTSVFPGWRNDCNYIFSELGRIWLVWVLLSLVIVYKKSAQYCRIWDPSSSVSFSAAFVHAFNTEIQRKELWRDISELNASTPLKNHY